MPVYSFKNPEKSGIQQVQTLKVPAARLRHAYLDAGGGNIREAYGLALNIFAGAKKEFEHRTMRQFDRFDANDGQIMREIMWRENGMKGIFNLLGLDYGGIKKIYLPWWNVIAAKELTFEENNGWADATLSPRHSYQSQLMRKGEDIPGMNSVSVAGLVHTSDNKLVVGLRGGLNFANTYYFNAGALQLSQELVNGETSIYRQYLMTEFLAEYGLAEMDVREASLLCRVALHGGDRDISYVFVLETNHLFETVRKCHEANKHPDKKEHVALEAVDADMGSIVSFVNNFYAGAVKSTGRADKPVLLPQGAAPLLVYAGANLELLER